MRGWCMMDVLFSCSEMNLMMGEDRKMWARLEKEWRREIRHSLMVRHPAGTYLDPKILTY